MQVIHSKIVNIKLKYVYTANNEEFDFLGTRGVKDVNMDLLLCISDFFNTAREDVKCISTV
jgi:hypothetical protein